MNTINDFKKGDRVLFGRDNGEKTLGEVIKVNRTKLKVRQLEARGTHRNYPVGTVWTVPPSLCEHSSESGSDSSSPSPVVPSRPVRKSPRELLAEKGIKRGDRVEFTFRRSDGVLTGRVARINAKRVTIEDIDSPKYPVGVYCNPSSILRKVEDAAPAPKVNVRVGQAVEFKGSAWVDGNFERNVTVKAVVTKVDNFNGSVEVFRHFGQDTFKADEFAPTTRSNDEIMGDIVSAYSGLEPEVLYCDGEASRAHVRAQSARLNRALKALFTELGRTVDSGEAWSWNMAQHEKAV